MSSSEIQWKIRLAHCGDAQAVADIYAPIVRETHLSAEFEPPDADEMRRRIESTLPIHPWLVAEHGGLIGGYAYATKFRTRPAYQWCAEVSVYIHEDCRRQGLGEILYRDLLGRIARQGFRHAIAVIALPNSPSVAFHEKLGFVHVGTFPGICHKLGRWYDIGWWRIVLARETHPAGPIQPTAKESP